MAAPTTPRKTCVLGDICICYGFSFAQIEVKTDGERITHKFYECKLKLNALKLANIRNVCDFSLNDLLDNTTGAATGIVEERRETESNGNIKSHFNEIETSARVGYDLSIWGRAQVQGLKEYRLTIRGDGDQALSPLRRLGRVPSFSSHALLVRVQCFREDLYKL